MVVIVRRMGAPSEEGLVSRRWHLRLGHRSGRLDGGARGDFEVYDIVVSAGDMTSCLTPTLTPLGRSARPLRAIGRDW